MLFVDISLPNLNSGLLVLCLVAQSCPALSEPMTAAPQAPLSIGILQARILEWIAMPSSRGSSQPRDQTLVSHIADGFFTIKATREALNKYQQIQNKQGLTITAQGTTFNIL